MTDPFESILDECISALQSGIPLEEVLAEVPDYASELRPMLHLATVLADPNPTLVATEQRAALRNKYLEQVARLPADPSPSLNQKLQAMSRVLGRRLTPQAVLSDLITVLITALLTLLMSLLMLSYAAQDTIPGDVLYGFKRIVEQTRLTMTRDEATAQTLQYEFNGRRLDEIEQMLAIGRVGVVDFDGVLESQGQNLWIVDGYPIVLTEDTTVTGEPQTGRTVHVFGFLRTNRDLMADRIEVRQ